MLRIMLFLSLTSFAFADDAATISVQANAAYQAREYAKAAKLYKSAVKAGAKSADVPYNAACCYSLLDKADEAFVWLNKAIDAGWRDVAHLKADTDLTRLQTDPRWKKVVQRCEDVQKAFVKSLKEPALREELLKRMKEDQRIRMEPNPDMKEWRKIDADNTVYMKTVIDKYGWPGKSMVGSDGALAAFLMVQHADGDHPFQKRCLELLKKAVEQNEARASDMAYLTDRILVRDGKPQIYGTQFTERDGKLVQQPIEDEANVDIRRKEVGLGPLAEYAKQMRAMQRPS